MNLSKAKAKKIGIEVWDYLAKHGEIPIKEDLPKNIFKKILKLQDHCPLCEYHSKRNQSCEFCILQKSKNSEYETCGDYYSWVYSKSNKSRAKYAAIIRDKIKEW